jgi:hypothetical protein
LIDQSADWNQKLSAAAALHNWWIVPGPLRLLQPYRLAGRWHQQKKMISRVLIRVI